MDNLQSILLFIIKHGLNHTVIDYKGRTFVSVIIKTLSTTDFTTLEDMIMNSNFHNIMICGDLLTFTGDYNG